MAQSFKLRLKKRGSKQLLEVKRRVDQFTLSGFAVAFSSSLILLHRFDWDSFRLVGYTVIRDRDITKYRSLGRSGAWQARALKRLKVKPKVPSAISVRSFFELFVTISRKYPLVTIHRESVLPDVCWIGPVVEVTADRVTIYELDSNCEWVKCRAFAFREITRVDFDGPYEHALAMTARRRPR
jgi:hypothetical protein